MMLSDRRSYSIVTKMISFCFLLSLYGCASTSKLKRITLAHGLPISHPVHKGIIVFKEVLAEKSGGTLDIHIYPDGQLGSEREVLELLQIGSIAATKVSAATMANFVPEYSVLGIPYIFRDKTHYFSVIGSDIGQLILDRGTAYGLQGLCFYDAGSRSFYTKTKPVRTPEDLKSLKIRVMNDPTAIKMVEALGGSPTPMSYGELYTALQQGVVDGAENNAPSFVTSRHFEICKHYTLDAHTYVPDVLIMGTKFMETLTAQEKQWIQEAAAVSAKAQKKFWEDSEVESYALLKEEGVHIYKVDQKPFSEQTEVVRSSFSDPALQTLIKQIQSYKSKSKE